VVVGIPGGRQATLAVSGGRLHGVTGPDGRTVHFAYDGAGRLTGRTDAGGHTATYGYDYAGLPAQASLPLGLGRSYTSPRRLPVANPAMEGSAGSPKTPPQPQDGGYVDARGASWAFRLHPTLAPVWSRDPTGQVTSWTRTAAGLVTELGLPTGRRTAFVHDARGNLTEVRDVATGGRWVYQYDGFDRLVRQTDPTWRVTTLTYDSLGNPNQVELADTTRWVLAYNARGLIDSVLVHVSPYKGGQRRRYNTMRYDEAGHWNLLAMRTYRGQFQADTDTVRLAYDAAGRLERVEDHRGGATVYVYDAANRLTRRTDPLGRAETWLYSAAGRDSVWTNRRGQSVVRVHDALGRLTQKHADVLSQYQYDGEGALVRAWNSGSDVHWFRDALGRDTATTQLVGGVTRRIGYTYRPGSWLRATMRDPEGGVHTYGYDGADRLTSVRDPETRTTTYGYDLAGRVLWRLQGNGQRSAYGYDSNGDSESVQVNVHGGTPIWSVAEVMGGAGPASWSYGDGAAWSFGHDWSSQLTEATLRDAGGHVLHGGGFTYDGAHNRTAGGEYTGGVFDAANRLLSATHAAQGLTTWTHDFDGNLTGETASGQSHSYSYDRENRIVAQSGAGFSASFAYDALGRRITVVANGVAEHYFFDGHHVLADYAANGARIARYTHGIRVDELLSVRRVGATYYHAQDLMGSVVLMTDGSGQVVNRYRYGAWGEELSRDTTVANRYTYTGRERVGDGRTLHYRARQYVPGLGRFTSEDPLEFVDGVILYAYVRNSPCMYVDPSGMSCKNARTMRLIGGTAVGVGAITLFVGTRSAQPWIMATGGVLIAGGLVAGYAGKHYEDKNCDGGSDEEDRSK
jgi:RHS repeat-associated protein